MSLDKQYSRSTHAWIEREIIRIPGTQPPGELFWDCEVCGPQPPVALADNRWVKRRCRCEREKQAHTRASLKRDYTHALIREKTKGHPDRGARMSRLGQLFSCERQPDDLPPEGFVWTCEVCGVIEPYLLPGGRWIKRNCACQRRERELQEEQARMAAWRDSQATRTFGGWLGPQWTDLHTVCEMKKKTFATYDSERQLEAYFHALDFAREPRGNLLFCGSYGTGKTHLEAAICNYVRDQNIPIGSRAGCSLFVSAPRFFQVYDETRKAFDQTNHIRLMEQIMGTPLLVIDDIDKSRPQDDRWEVFWLIFDTRCTARRPTIVSTNNEANLNLFIGDASLSRLSRGLVTVEMSGPDYRLEEE